MRLSEAAALPEIVWETVEEIPLRIARLIAEVEAVDWCNTLAVVGHRVRIGPGDATVLRQLTIPGVHSKWIEQHAVLVGAILGVPADASAGDPITRLITHVGLLAKQTPVQVTLACPQLRSQAGGLRRFQATIPVLNKRRAGAKDGADRRKRRTGPNTERRPERSCDRRGPRRWRANPG